MVLDVLALARETAGLLLQALNFPVYQLQVGVQVEQGLLGLVQFFVVVLGVEVDFSQPVVLLEALDLLLQVFKLRELRLEDLRLKLLPR